MREHLRLLRALRPATAKPVVQFEPPPPLPIEHVLAYPNELFRKAVDKRKLSSDCLRYKFWRVQSGIYREFCAKIGIDYIQTTPEMRGSQGMLAEAAWGSDATHANEWFGQRMIGQMLETYPAKVDAQFANRIGDSNGI
jgi:hypothetical protein